jgi:hypothetical protein
MVNFLNGIRERANSLYDTISHNGVAAKQGILVVGEEASRVMYDIYSLVGFEKWTKAVIADLKFLSLLPVINGVFDECIKTLEAQKDLYYATLFVGSTAECIKVTEKEDQTKAYSFQLPKTNGHTDIVKILYAIGNYLEMGKFLQKYQVYSFPLFTQVADRLASVKVFAYRGDWRVDDLPVISTLCDKPKDFFIFLASGIEVYRCSKKPLLQFDNVLKATGSIGKMLLISLGRDFNKEWWFVGIDVITQHASLIAFLWKRHQESKERFKRNFPVVNV